MNNLISDDDMNPNRTLQGIHRYLMGLSYEIAYIIEPLKYIIYYI